MVGMAAKTAARRTPGTGTMRERPPGCGRWQLRAFAGVDELTGKPRQVTKTFIGTEAKARVALGRFVNEVTDGKFEPSTATVGEVLEKWLDAATVSQRPRTLEENRRKIEHRICPVLGKVKLNRLTPALLDRVYREWLDEGLSPATVHKYHALLSAACRQAVKWGWLAFAPTERARPPKIERKEIDVPSPDRLKALIRAAEKEDTVLATAVALAALTGARRGELVALRWSDIDLEAGSVRIARSLTVAGGEHHVGPTKTHATRALALDPAAVAVLRHRWTEMEDLSERAESPLVDDPCVLSYNANGAIPANPDTFTHRFRALCDAMEAPALKRLRKRVPKATKNDLAPKDRWPYRFHDLRHFSVTTLIAGGVDIRTVAERHGHARATMTLDRYAHALPERDREAGDLLGATLTL
jgi:integrase